MKIEVDSQIINHLLFHKALIDEADDMSRIDKYLDMIKISKEKENLTINDPFDRSIILAFDLVLNQKLNPWDIDLVNFSSMYIKNAHEKKIDLIIAGRIIYMAWKVLRMQSDSLVSHMESKIIDENNFGWDDIPTGNWFESDDGYSYTNLVMKNPIPPIEEPIRRDPKRKISLIELLDAFNQARKESEEYRVLDELRKTEREKLALKAKKSFKGTTHEDHLEEDIIYVWNKIQKYPNKSIRFSSICKDNDFEERIKIFLSILFLAYDKKIKLTQRKFPFGEIYIKTINYT